MDILEAIRSRRSVRDFTNEEIAPEEIDALIEAVRWAPSAGNLQSRKFSFVFDREVKKRLARAALGQDFIARAPLVIVACTDNSIAVRYGDRGVNLYSIQDSAASVMNLMLAAHELGLGTCWVGAFNEFDVHEALGLSGNLRPIAIVPVGHPRLVPRDAPKRLSAAEIVNFVR